MTMLEKGEENYWLLYMYKHEHDDQVDQFWQMEENMTVFGFGRKPHEEPGTYLTEVPVNLTIGLFEMTDHESVLLYVNSLLDMPVINTGEVQYLNPQIKK